MAKSQTKGSKKQDTPEQSGRRDSAWQRGKDRKVARHAVQLKAEKHNLISGSPKPWEIVREKRKHSRKAKQQLWLRQNPIHLIP